MARATAAATADRVDQLQQMILAGSSNTECVSYARQAWGNSRPKAFA